MPTVLPSFAKINLGLAIGPRREDGFHQLATIYHTVELHDVVRVKAGRGLGIELRCRDPRVPLDHTNTCWRMAERVLRLVKQRAAVSIEIEKRLPIEGGLGAASSNAVATLLGLERQLKLELTPTQKLELCAEVGSDLPLFLVGGAVLGLGRGEQVLPLSQLPSLPVVLVTPPIGVSTPQAFAAWDELQEAAGEADARSGNGRVRSATGKLTAARRSDRMDVFCRSASEWLSGSWNARTQFAGVPAREGGDRAEALLLDLVRAGIENDFERVVFSLHPELRQVKRALEREGARYASLSGSGSTVYGLFASPPEAERAAAALAAAGHAATATRTLPRAEYLERLGG